MEAAEAKAATRIVQRQRTAIARMQKGIEILFSADEAVLQAFRIGIYENLVDAVRRSDRHARRYGDAPAHTGNLPQGFFLTNG